MGSLPRRRPLRSWVTVRRERSLNWRISESPVTEHTRPSQGGPRTALCWGGGNWHPSPPPPRPFSPALTLIVRLLMEPRPAVKAGWVPDDLITMLPTCDTVQMAKGPGHISGGPAIARRQELRSYSRVRDKKHPSIKPE